MLSYNSAHLRAFWAAQRADWFAHSGSLIQRQPPLDGLDASASAVSRLFIPNNGELGQFDELVETFAVTLFLAALVDPS